MRKFFLAALLSVALPSLQELRAQTNLQLFYDFGSDRRHITTTLEGFYNDAWGNTFFFVDHDFASRDRDGRMYAPSGTYMEIARCLNFWQETALAPLSLQVEYDGGVYNGYTVNNALLLGVDWFTHSADWRNTFNFKLLYKTIARTAQQLPLQLTFVWGMDDLFGLTGLRFSGFADFWWEDHTLTADRHGVILPETSRSVFISEPQLWYNVGQHFGCANLNLGGEVELSWDFGTKKGFWCRPCAGLKWIF